VDPEVLFEEYLYEPRFSDTFQKHFDEMAEHIDLMVARGKKLVVDIGSNDGTLLSKFKKRGWKVVGVEPSEAQAEYANRQDIHTIEHFWGDIAGRTIEAYFGKADIVTATNVFAHVDNLHEFLDEVRAILKPKGMLVIEVPYLYDMFAQGTFDLVYHEHLSYFHLLPMERLFDFMDMEIVRVERIDIHGGSVRVFAARKGERSGIHPADHALLLAKELEADVKQDLQSFALLCEAKRNTFQAYVMAANVNGQTVVGYTSPAKATVLINYCGFTGKDIKYIVDNNPLKAGKFLPGSNIPVVEGFVGGVLPDVIVVFAWNIVEDILPKLPSVPVVTAMPELKRAVLVDTDDYTLDAGADQHLDDIPVAARVATSGVFVGKSVTAGVADADNITFSSVSGDQSETIVVYQDTGTEATSRLIGYIDTATGLPITPTGSDIDVQWDDGANRIFKL
jgi:SAM-dependent methyltransferase